jgi:glycosyltransferase involved in cell wall biosynthesis
VKKILWIGDGVTPTGFATVNHNIIKYLPEEEYEVHHIAINYFGDPHSYKHKIYPASNPQSMRVGDLYGYNRIGEFVNKDIDMIFILNDIWVITQYLEIIKQLFGENIPKLVVYFPVDGAGYDREWFTNFDIVTKVVVYTEFGKAVVLDAYPELQEKLEVIPHGNDTKTFYPVEDKLKLRKETFDKIPELWEEDAFIVLNANRNQPRKRIDLSLRGFALFAAKKPKNVRYYHHAGLKDAGWDILSLVKQIDRDFFKLGLLEDGDTLLQDRIIVTNLEKQVQKVPIEKLNEVYNLCNVGINTSLGEGWGLISTEHAATRAAQVVPNHTACAELFHDCGILVDIRQTVNDKDTLLARSFVDIVSLANGLEALYKDKKLREELAEKAYKKFTSDAYNWKNIAKTWNKIFKDVLSE